jgi:aldehyde dehydrogenase (NAD+)
VQSEVRRDPHGTVLILGTWNYPVFLVGVQAAQALAAGNHVWLKPAVGCEAITHGLADAFYQVGVPERALQVLESSNEAATQAIDSGVDLIVLTGAASTGRKVLRRAAETLTPTIMELSGCDAVVVMPGADLDRVAKAVAFGLTINSGATCIGPRRLIVESSMAERVLPALSERLKDAPSYSLHPAARESVVTTIERALAGGAVDHLGQFDAERLRRDGSMRPLILDRVRATDEIASADLFAPVLSLIRVSQIAESVKLVNDCPYRLAASVFGPRKEAERLASQLRVGSVSVNDLIMPTADPRVPFGGRGHSGFGVTRGEEGLLAMTVPVVTAVRRGRWAPHLMPRSKSDAQALLGALQLLHARTLADRWAGLKQILAAPRRSGADDVSSKDAE